MGDQLGNKKIEQISFLPFFRRDAMKIKGPYLLAGLVLIFLGLISINAAKRLSPTWDEISYPASGYAQLKTGRLDFITAAPYLSRVFYALPLLALSLSLPDTHFSWKTKDSGLFGFQFVYRNAVDPQKIIFWSRMPALVFSLFFATLLFGWIASRLRPWAGVLGLLGYISVPVFLARSSFALMEMPMLFFMLLALWAHYKWFENQQFYYVALTGLFCGLAAACKLTSLPLIPALVWLELFSHPRQPALLKRLGTSLLMVVVMALTVVILYLPWGGSWDALRNVLGALNYDQEARYYWSGGEYRHAPALMSYLAFVVKMPPLMVVLALIGACSWWASGENRLLLKHFLSISFFSLLSVFFFSNAVTTIQLSPFYIGAAGCFGGLIFVFEQKKMWRRVAVGGLLLLCVADPLRSHPNTSAYINDFFGGPKKGYRWLADSDQDWGQALPLLGEYLSKNKIEHVVMAHCSAGDPAAYGIHYQDLFSPSLVSRDRRDVYVPDDAQRVHLVIATKVFQTNPEVVGWFVEQLTPVAQVGFCYWVYDISNHKEALHVLGDIYAAIGRADRARWAFSLARRAEDRSQRR